MPSLLPPEAEAAHEKRISGAIDRLADRAGIPRARRHINMGEVAAELSAAARRTHADIVVMGAVSRSALTRFFIGNTAERVLDQLTCDVLIVKPRGFGAKPLLARRAVAAAKSRATAKSAPRARLSSSVVTRRTWLPPLL